MIGSPHRKHRAGKLGHVTQKKPAAIVWSQRCHTLIGAYRPGMCEVLAQRETDDMNDSQMGWQHWPH